VSGPCRVCFCSPLRRRPDAATRPTARDVSQRAEPNVRPLGRAVSAFITDKTRRLTGDVPPQHLMRPVALLADGDQTIPQAACLSIPMAGDTTILPHAPRSSSLVRGQGSFRCTPILRKPRISGRKEIALATSISCSKYYICYVPGPACRGSAPLCVSPLSYKRGGTQRYRLKLTQTHLDAHKFIQALKLNTSHSGVGYYAPAARTTLNPCVFLCSSRFHLTGKTLRPILILGFRAGAFRHPPGDFLSDKVVALKNMTHKEVIEFIIEHTIHRFDIPQTLTTDMGLLLCQKRYMSLFNYIRPNC
jgi:hypothetical protein